MDSRSADNSRSSHSPDWLKVVAIVFPLFVVTIIAVDLIVIWSPSLLKEDSSLGRFIPDNRLLVGFLLGSLVTLVLAYIFHRYIRRYQETLEQLHISESRFADIAANASEWIWEVDSTGRYTYVSPVIERVLGYTVEEALQKHFYDFFHPDDKDELKAGALQAFASHQPFQNFINRNVHKDGTSVWLSTSGIPVIGPNDELLGYRGADLVQTDQEGITDSLTGALNRSGFELLGTRQMELANRQGTAISLIFADLDNLKPINDEFGHDQGDQALRDAASLLKRCVNNIESVFRLGGDEFVLLVKEKSTSSASADRMINEIQNELHAFNEQAERPYKLAISAAAATSNPEENQQIYQILRKADLAMYAIKRARHGRRTPRD